MEKILASVIGHGPGIAPSVNVIVRWTLSESFQSVEQSFAVDMTLSPGNLRQNLRDQIASAVAAITRGAYTAADVVGLDELTAQIYGLVPLTVLIGSLVAADDLVRVTVPSILNHPNVQIDSAPWSMAARALVSGTATLVIKNNAGTILASRGITSAGTFTFTPSVSTIDAGDTLRFGFSGIGVGLSDVSVTGWLRVPLGV